MKAREIIKHAKKIGMCAGNFKSLLWPRLLIYSLTNVSMKHIVMRVFIFLLNILTAA